MRNPEAPLSVPEMSARRLESELQTGAPVVILDVRDEDEFEDWHIDAEDAPLLNVPLSRIEADPRAVAEALDAGERELRVVCARGKSSVVATRLLNAQGASATSVRGGMMAWSRILTSSEVPVSGAATIVQFRREARGCLSYLVLTGGDALVVDPAPDVSAYLAEAERHEARISQVIDTHVHADHLSGMRELGRATGAAMLLSDGAFARGARIPGATGVRDGDRIGAGRTDVQVVGLPGHTTDNIGLLVDGRALIAGDSLFADSVARPDLEAGDTGVRDAARLLYRTLHERVLSLPEDTVLLPCHYPGGRRTSAIAPTLGEVRAGVGLLAADEHAFVDEVLAEMPPRPANYREIIATNLGGGEADDAGTLEIGANNCAVTVAPGPGRARA